MFLTKNILSALVSVAADRNKRLYFRMNFFVWFVCALRKHLVYIFADTFNKNDLFLPFDVLSASFQSFMVLVFIEFPHIQ